MHIESVTITGLRCFGLPSGRHPAKRGSHRIRRCERFGQDRDTAGIRATVRSPNPFDCI